MEMEEAPPSPPRGDDAAVDRPILVHRVIARLNIGGPALHVVSLTSGMDESERFDTRLLAGRTTGDEGDMTYYARDRGVEVTELPGLSRRLSPLGDLGVLWTLFRLFRRDRPTIVHTHTAKAGTLGRLAALLAGVPVRIHTFHGHVLGGGYFSPWATRAYLEIERQLARISQRLIVLSHRQEREMVEELNVAPASQFTVVPLGLDLRPFQQVNRELARRTTRERLGIEESEVVVGIVGRLVPVKNHDLLFRTHRVLEQRIGRRLRILVVGAGLREEELRRMVDTLGIGEKVLWLGWQRDLQDLYPAMDALALTSFDEGTPVAILEALAAGTPVAARSVGGVPEILVGVPFARLIPEATVGSVARTLEETLRLTPKGNEVEEVRRDISERFSEKRLVEDMKALYLRELTAVGLRTGADGKQGVG